MIQANARWEIINLDGVPHKRAIYTIAGGLEHLGALLPLHGRELWDWQRAQSKRLQAEAEAIQAAHEEAAFIPPRSQP